VKDASGRKLGYFYFEEEPGRSAAKLLTKDEADRRRLRRVAGSIAALKNNRPTDPKTHAADEKTSTWSGTGTAAATSDTASSQRAPL
jgi:DNA-binding protein H-NS